MRVLAMIAVFLTGCAAKKPMNYRFTGCQVEKTWVDEHGAVRKECDCKNGREIGRDARTRLAIIRCE